MVLLLRPWLPAAALLPAFVVYRAVYYLLPFVVALLALVADEARQRRAHARARRRRGWAALTEQLTPRAAGGVHVPRRHACCSVSGATPAAPGRLDLLDRLLPLGVIETSHFLGSVAGAGLLVLSQGLARRLDAAYYLSSLLIVVGMVRVAAQGLRRRGGGAAARACCWCCAAPGRPSIAAPRSSRRASRPAGSRRVVGALGASVVARPVRVQARRVRRPSSGGSSSCAGEASRFLRRRSARRSSCCWSALARLIGQPPPRGRAARRRRPRRRRRASSRRSRPPSPNLVFLRDKGAALRRERATAS